MSQKIDYKRIGSSVRNGIIRYGSVSQIMTFNTDQFGGCNRAWWFAKIMRLERPQTAAQDTGVEMHRQIETYLATGDDVLGVVPRAGLRFLPSPGAGLNLEMPFGDEKIVEMFDKYREFGTIENPSPEFHWIETVLEPLRDKYLIADGDVPILGAIDVVNERGEWIDNEGLIHKTPNEIEVIDWKSTSDIEQYAKSGPELIDTDQMIGYAKYASQRFPTANQIRISHGYFQTRGAPRAKKVSTLVPLDIIQSRWQHIETRVREMKQVARETDVEKVPANLNACSAYRGCTFASQCPRSAKSTIMAAIHAAEKPERNMGLLDQLRNKNAGTPAPASAKTPVNTPTVDAEIARLKAEEQALDMNTGHKPELMAAIAVEVAKHKIVENRGVCNVDGQTLTPENSSKLPDGKIVHVGCKPAGVMPPDAPASNPATNAAPVPPEALASLPADVRTIVENHGATPPATAAETPTAKRGRGRPKSDTTTTTTSQASTNETDGLSLYVDCIVKGRGVPTDLGSYIDKLCAELCTLYKAVDIRCAPSDSPLSFGKWKGALAAAIRENPPENGTYVLYSVRDSEIRQVVVETLEPLCAVFVRGV